MVCRSEMGAEWLSRQLQQAPSDAGGTAVDVADTNVEAVTEGVQRDLPPITGSGRTDFPGYIDFGLSVNTESA